MRGSRRQSLPVFRVQRAAASMRRWAARLPVLLCIRDAAAPMLPCTRLRGRRGGAFRFARAGGDSALHSVPQSRSARAGRMRRPARTWKRNMCVGSDRLPSSPAVQVFPLFDPAPPRLGEGERKGENLREQEAHNAWRSVYLCAPGPAASRALQGSPQRQLRGRARARPSMDRPAAGVGVVLAMNGGRHRPARLLPTRVLAQHGGNALLAAAAQRSTALLAHGCPPLLPPTPAPAP